MITFLGSSLSNCLATQPILLAPAVWELEGPTIIGPKISNILGSSDIRIQKYGFTGNSAPSSFSTNRLTSFKNLFTCCWIVLSLSPKTSAACNHPRVPLITYSRFRAGLTMVVGVILVGLLVILTFVGRRYGNWGF